MYYITDVNYSPLRLEGTRRSCTSSKTSLQHTSALFIEKLKPIKPVNRLDSYSLLVVTSDCCHYQGPADHDKPVEACTLYDVVRGMRSHSPSRGRVSRVFHDRPRAKTEYILDCNF